MQLRVLETSESVARLVALDLWESIEAGARRLGFATGRTMIDVYREFVELAEALPKNWNWSGIQTYNLDEYVGLGPQNSRSFHYFMQQHLFLPLALDNAHTHVPNGLAPDLERECQEYEEIATESPIDVQLLGLGINGHIGFNEPGTPFSSTTHIVKLSGATLQQNAPDFDGSEPPGKALTMGIQTILNARRIMLVATGIAKAQALEALLYGPVGTECPASALRLHPQVSVYVDRALMDGVLERQQSKEVPTHEIRV